MPIYSISPKNEKFEIPDKNKTKAEISKIKDICNIERDKGKEIVVVQGLGFVGAVNSAVIADCKIEGRKPYYVMGVDLPTKNSFWKIPMINGGNCPFEAEDPEVEKIFNRTVKIYKNLRATWVSEAYSEADIILVDINLDVVKKKLGNAKNSYVEIDNFKKSIEEIGKRTKPESLILVETTVPPGTVENIIKPIIEKIFIERNIDINVQPPLIAHSYERVMPGKDYISSIKEIWRSYSGINKKSSEKVKKFLSNIIDTKKFPLWHLPRPTASEIAKIMENSYRAMNIAFIHEWTLYAEDIGINLFEVVDSIRVRKGTHDNMMYPGFGVGGYCLTKDPLLAQWASKEIFKRKEHLNFSVEAVNINDLMPTHTFDLLMKGMDNNIKGKKIVILGASYRKDVDDTRNSPTVILYDEIIKNDGIPYVHDPFAKRMFQRDDIKISSDMDSTLNKADAVIFVVNHREYLNLSMGGVIEKIKSGSCLIDAFNILSNDKITYLKNNGFKVLGVGKGHIKYL